MKDISRMSDKKLKFRYGKSDGTDRAAEDELRRRGLNDRQIRGVIYGYRQGEYAPKGGPYPDPEQDAMEEESSSDEAAEPNAASDKEPVMYFGEFKGLPVAEVPQSYLEWCYGSFTKGRRRLARELRSRGYQDGDLERCRRQHPILGKYPKRQGPKD